MSGHLYAIALGSNRSSRCGSPTRAVEGAFTALASIGHVTARSSIHTTPALGPSRRRFANAAALVETDLVPPALLTELKAIEHRFGRRSGQRWGDRVIDLDLLLWNGGRWQSGGSTGNRTRTLAIPHIHLANRRFVLDPLVEIASGWRLPGTALTVRHLRARLTRARPSA